MKKVVLPAIDLMSVPVSRLRGYEILAYKCPDSDQIMMLTRIASKISPFLEWGFVPVGTNKFGPSYHGRTQIDAATRAASERNVYAFDNIADFSKALWQKTIV